MKKILFTAIIALAGWFNAQGQMMPSPEKYTEYITQVYELAATDQNKAEFLMNATMEALSKDPKAYRQMMELAERRFSDAADPIHNEGLYMAVLKHATEKFILGNAEKEKQRLLLEGAKKNMIGTVAADFDYITPKDKTVHHLKDLKADYILVYFNNPDCESCEAVKERLASNELVNQLIKDNKLIVLGIYPYDDQKLWKKAKYPSMMINGWNQSRQIEYTELYDLPTLPCFYLLDKDYKVLIKNEGSLNKVEAMLKKLTTEAPEPAKAPEAPKASAPDAENTSKLNRTAVNPTPKIIPAPADDPHVATCEQMLGYLVENQFQALYDNLADNMKAQVTPATFDGAFAQVENRFGKYLGHEAWEIQEVQNIKAYTALVSFEKDNLGIFVIFDNDGKVKGINLVPAKAINK